jgi:molybdate transport system ATP-binding protein
VADGEPLAILRGATVVHGERRLLDSIDWTIRVGERWRLEGPNGAGKSTLLALLRADHPQLWRNEIELLGMSTGVRKGLETATPDAELERSGPTLDIAKVRREVALVGPEAMAFLPARMRVRSVVLSGAEGTVEGVRAATWMESERAREWLGRLGLDGVAEEPFGGLPPSLQRRVLLARALCSRPRLLLLDECFHGLARVDRDRMEQGLAAALPEIGAVVWVSHDAADHPAWLNRRMRLEAGRVTPIPGS